MSSLSKRFIENLQVQEREAELKFKSIELNVFLSDIIVQCLNQSKDYADEVLKVHFKDLEDNYLKTERNFYQLIWEKNITNNFRNDDSIYREAINNLQKGKSYQSYSDTLKITKIVIYIVNYIENKIYNYRDRLFFLENFEKQVKESMLYEVLFNTLKQIESEKKKNNSNSKKKKKENSKYKPKEIKIAYFCLKKDITDDNYLEILNKYSDSRSNKILQYPICKTSDLTRLSENKSADTKHFTALKNARNLLSGINDYNALKSINEFISTFEANYKNHYE